MKRGGPNYKYIFSEIIDDYVMWVPNRPTSAIFGGLDDWAKRYHGLTIKDVLDKRGHLLINIEIDFK